MKHLSTIHTIIEIAFAFFIDFVNRNEIDLYRVKYKSSWTFLRSSDINDGSSASVVCFSGFFMRVEKVTSYLTLGICRRSHFLSFLA